MKKPILGLSIFILALASSPVPVVASDRGGFKAMAKELPRAALAARVQRVAVLPFVPAQNNSVEDGWRISEKLVTQLVRLGKIEALERSLLSKLLDEHQLGKTGVLDPTMLRKLGRVAAADGIITGSFAVIGPNIVVNARLINLETGVIIAACEREVEREWTRGLLAHSNQPLFVPAPEFTVEVPQIAQEESLELKDSPGEDSCAAAPLRIDRMENQILELKARYWARRLKKGLSSSSLKYNPGSTISDPELKQQFYERMKAWYAQDSVPELTPSELKRFVAVDQKALSLYRKCGI
ncbi:MAG: hypothetical protein A3J74_09725 [Elusimicrobia bacterium RIFCSPHIGHO2_02_FULL_57_9]|nr:MAG: hypothetical protein A3J74_09725 [Elusimicrobia bacterium RIFCSPHIGHO2_02_FULL_57_9]